MIHVWETPSEKARNEAQDKHIAAQQHYQLFVLAELLAQKNINAEQCHAIPYDQKLEIPWWAGIATDEHGNLCVVHLQTKEKIVFGRKQS